MNIDLSREQRPSSPDETLVYYDGPQLFWLPSPEGQHWLALALPDDVGPWPFLVCDLTESAANSLLTGASLRATVLGAQTHWLLRDYEEEVLQMEPLSTLPEDWLPGDVALSLFL
jgi:hypothetical protein